MNLRSGFSTTPEKRVWYPIDPSRIPRKPTRSPIDFSKMPKKPVSLPIVFQPTADEKLSEALAEIEALKKSKLSLEQDFRDHMNERTRQISDLLQESREAGKKLKEAELMNECLKLDLEETQNRCNKYQNRANQLHQRIRDPFKFAPPSPF